MTASVEGPDLGELARLEAQCTPGPWFRWFSDAQKADHIRSASREWVAQFAATEADADFIAALRNAAPFLLAQAAAATKARDVLLMGGQSAEIRCRAALAILLDGGQ